MMARRSGIDAARHLFEGVACACLFVLMVLVLVDVLARNLLNAPLPWGTELLEIVLATSIFVMFPVIALQRSHITVDLVSLPAWERLQQGLSALLGAVVFGLITWALWRQAVTAADFGEATPLLEMPLVWVFGGLAALAGCATLAFLISPWRSTAQKEAH